MAVTTKKLETTGEWLSGIDDRWVFIQATEGQGIILTRDEVLALVEQNDWAEIEDDSDLPHVTQGISYPSSLMIGSGDLVKALRKEPGHSVEFVSAYLKTHDA